MEATEESNRVAITPVSHLGGGVIAKLKEFDCGDKFLNDFAHKKLLKNDKKDLHKGFAIEIEGRVAGYMTTRVNNLDREYLEQGNLPKTIPTLSLEQIATDLRFRGEGLGKKLTKKALELTVSVSSGTGVKGLHLWSHPKALGFYKSLGFQVLYKDEKSDPELTLMFMPIETIRKAMTGE